MNNIMKNKINKYLFILISIVSITACDKALDVTPEGVTTLNEVFNDEVNTGAYLNSCYKGFKAQALNYKWATSLPINLSDDAIQLGTTPAPKAIFGISSNWNIFLNSGFDVWTVCVTNIRKCNIFLSRIDDAVVESEEERARYKAECKVLRSLYYMTLIEKFGGVAIIYEPASMDYPGKKLQRQSFKACADSIIKTCESIMDVEELPWRTTTKADKNRMTKAIACAIESRTALLMASPLFCEDNDYWDEAAQITKRSLDRLLEHGYELYSTVRNADLYGDNAYYEYNTSGKDDAGLIDKETIYIAPSSDVGWAWSMSHGVKYVGTSRAGLCPSQELVDAFPMKDGTYVLNLENPYNDEKHLSPNFNLSSSYNLQDPYANRDPRFDAIIYHNGSTLLNKKGKYQTIYTYEGDKTTGIKVNSTAVTCTGYYPRKYSHPLLIKGRPRPVIDYRNFALNEMYLNYAEAAAEAGYLDEAVAAVKPIRDRVKMPNITNGTQDYVIAEIRNERRIELAYQDNRYIDIRRWKSPGETLDTKYTTGMWIINKGTKSNPSYEYHRFLVGTSYDSSTNSFIGEPLTKATYTPKYLLWGLDFNEANKLKAYTGFNWQNPGWL